MIEPNPTRSHVEPWAAYDAYASRYDLLLHENCINAYMRREMTRTLLTKFVAGNRLIEFGCGTGDEAIELARHDCQVVAFDPSPQMVQIAAQKVSEAHLASVVRLDVATAAEAVRVLRESNREMSFDGAYASFSLSYEPELGTVASGLAHLVGEDGRLVLAHMNRICGVELLAAALSGRPRLAGRRLAGRTMHKVGMRTTTIFARSADELRRAFLPYFDLETVRALPALMPPHYANRWLMRWPGLMRRLSEVDPRLGSLPVVRLLGDHNLLCFRRTNYPARIAAGSSRRARPRRPRRA